MKTTSTLEVSYPLSRGRTARITYPANLTKQEAQAVAKRFTSFVKGFMAPAKR